MAEPAPDAAADYAAWFLARWGAYADGSSDEPPGDLAPEYLRVLLDERQQSRTDRFALLDVLAELVAYDGQQCRLDATGECAPHAYPTEEAGFPCPYRRARDLLDAAGPKLERRRQRQAAQARGQLERMLDDAGRMRP